MPAVGKRGLSAGLLAFIKGKIHGKLTAIEQVLDGTAFAEDVASQRNASLWSQIHENRQLLDTLRAKAPELLAANPEIERSLAHRDAFLLDLAKIAELDNWWALTEPEGYPMPWPGTEQGPAHC